MPIIDRLSQSKKYNNTQKRCVEEFNGPSDKGLGTGECCYPKRVDYESYVDNGLKPVFLTDRLESRVN